MNMWMVGFLRCLGLFTAIAHPSSAFSVLFAANTRRVLNRPNQEMTRIGKLLVFCLLGGWLTSCAYYDTYQEQVTRRKACYLHCEQSWRQCTQLCVDNDKVCRAQNDARAAVHFVQYQQQQAVKGQIMTAELLTFRDPLACGKTSCDCEQDKNMCQQQCRGTIYKRMQAVM